MPGDEGVGDIGHVFWESFIMCYTISDISRQLVYESHTQPATMELRLLEHGAREVIKVQGSCTVLFPTLQSFPGMHQRQSVQSIVSGALRTFSSPHGPRSAMNP